VVTGLYVDCALAAFGFVGAEDGEDIPRGDSTSLGEELVDGELGSTSSLIRLISVLRLICLSSSVSWTAWSSRVRPNFFRVLPVLEPKSALPVELERRDRLVTRGEEEGEVWVEVGVDIDCELTARSLCVPVLNILGMTRRFSSIVDAGEAERGESIYDMLRLGGAGRKVVEVIKGGGPIDLDKDARGDHPSEKATQMPERTMNLRRVSSVLTVSRSVELSKNELGLMLAGVGRGLVRPEGG